MVAIPLFLLISLFTAENFACRCIAPNLYRDVMKANDVVVAKVVKQGGTYNGTYNRWAAQVAQTVSGCMKVNSMTQVISHQSSASCGVQLTLDTYFLVGRFDNVSNTLLVNSCNYNRLWSSLLIDEVKFANNHYNNCTRSCSIGRKVNCFVEPCAFSPCSVTGAFCRDEYCNGCFAYWFLNDYERVCVK
jgi:hypothetical protein